MKKLGQGITILLIGFSLGMGTVKWGNTPQLEAGDEMGVTGVGGIFFKTPDPGKTRAWYQEHLGLNTNQYGTVFEWRQSDTPEEKGHAQWSPFNAKTKFFEGDYMINYRVKNLEVLLKNLRASGIEVLDSLETFDYGKFVHIKDLDGRKVELWEPIDSVFATLTEGAITK